MSALNDAALDQLFRTARTRNGWSPEPLPESVLRQLYDLLRWGPTSANCSPARFVFVTSEAGKARLSPHLSSSNRKKMLAAPVCVIIGYDLDFAAKLPKLFPHEPTAPSWFADPQVRQTTAFRNGSLQAGYMILAARSLGLDCGPMSGFDTAGVDAEFFAGTSIRTNLICNIGYGTDENLYVRNPRLDFEEACSLA